MSQSNSAPREFWILLNGALDGTLSSADMERLECLLDGDFGLQTLFRNYCQLHINLDAETRAQRVVDNLRCEESGLLDRSWHEEIAVALPSTQRAVAQRRSSKVRQAAWLGLAACSVVLAVALVTVAVRNRDSKPALRETIVADDADQNLDIITVRLSSAESRFLPIGDVGDIYIQGPAYLELIGTGRARLHEGRVKIRITDPRGRGFVVETPQGNVTDLGTEFGVDVSNGQNTGVVVFEGAVDLELPADGPTGAHVERLLQGEGLSVSKAGQLDRIMSIVTGKVATFQQRGEKRLNGFSPIIVDVSDNIRSPELRKFYEIVPGGLREDALAYADRPAHDWSGVDEKGIPKYLIGADYVKPFNSDKMRSDVKIYVSLACPARLFVFSDDRVTVPDWLRANFRDTGDDIGHDVGAYVLDGVEFFRLTRGIGPGKSIDSIFSIWEQVVPRPATIELGPNSGSTELTAMYGIAAISLEQVPDTAPPQNTDESFRTGGVN